MLPLGLSVLLGFVIGSAGQTQQPLTFIWGFTTLTGSTINQCETVYLFAGDPQGGTLNDTIKPPFMFHAYAPQTPGNQTIIGTDPMSLNWTVPYPAGTQLLLSMVDSKGVQGGVSGVVTVADGPSSACIPTPITTTFAVTVNTTMLNTCDPLDITISGGTRPYSVVVVIANDTEFSVPLSPNVNRYTWYNRAAPGQQVLVTAWDVNGDYAIDSGFISTQGSNDTTCPGLVDGSVGDQFPILPVKRKHMSLAVIAGCAGGAATFIIASVLFYFCFWRRKDQDVDVHFDLDGGVKRGKTIRDVTPYYSIHANTGIAPDARYGPFQPLQQMDVDHFRPDENFPRPGANSQPVYTQIPLQSPAFASQLQHAYGHSSPPTSPPLSPPLSLSSGAQPSHAYDVHPIRQLSQESIRSDARLIYPRVASTTSSEPRSAGSGDVSYAAVPRDDASSYRSRPQGPSAGFGEQISPSSSSSNALRLGLEARRGNSRETIEPVVRYQDGGGFGDLPPAYAEQQRHASSSRSGPRDETQ
ncbi:hypothetical protein BD410DRAFT_825708 [Rickenella mellea]|uniref:Mid2 domain-containing protein n=1 Tax=Rickenella mellea TaxID=50990 RepID=A0A4Y7QH78_9AGAM|nr:hypothetical protein BD410DRAFT_825708 [Rickenella mellea]